MLTIYSDQVIERVSCDVGYFVSEALKTRVNVSLGDHRRTTRTSF